MLRCAPSRLSGAPALARSAQGPSQQARCLSLWGWGTRRSTDGAQASAAASTETRHDGASGSGNAREEPDRAGELPAAPRSEHTESLSSLSPASGGEAVAADAGAPDASALEAVSDAQQTAEAATALSSDWYDPVMTAIESLHESAGLPWWATVAAITVAARTAVLPLTLSTIRNSAKMQAVKPDLDALKQRMQAASSAGDDQQVRRLHSGMMELMRQNGISPVKSLVNPVVQMPLFVSFFLALRKLAEVESDALAHGGMAWFENLAAPDPFYALPVVTAGTFLVMVQLGAESGGAQMPRMMMHMMRALAVVMVPFTANFPAVLFCYWLPNNLFSIAQGAAMRAGVIRRAMGLPPLGVSMSQARSDRLASAQSKPISAEAAAASYMRGDKPSDAPATRAAPKLYTQPPTASSGEPKRRRHGRGAK